MVTVKPSFGMSIKMSHNVVYVLLKSLLALLLELFNPCVSRNATLGVHFPEYSNLLCSFHVMLNGMGIA